MRKIPRFRPERPTQSPVCRPFRPLIIGSRFPVAHATGIGYVGPSGLKLATSKAGGDGFLSPTPSARRETILSKDGAAIPQTGQKYNHAISIQEP